MHNKVYYLFYNVLYNDPDENCIIYIILFLGIILHIIYFILDLF